MAAYVDRSIHDFIAVSDDEIVAELHRAYARDGFSSQYTAQATAWDVSVPLVKAGLGHALDREPELRTWRILLEYPLYRLRHRVDLIFVSPQAVLVVEAKVGQTQFLSADARQAEEYALDLRDFHEFSRDVPLVPCLWCTEAEPRDIYSLRLASADVGDVARAGRHQLGPLLLEFSRHVGSLPSCVREDWGDGAYKPVPSIIEAATTLFAGHGVEEISRADAANLEGASASIVSLVAKCRAEGRRGLIFLTGVPGSGKTLAGLHAVHSAIQDSGRRTGDVVYLSGNTPLVTVLRESLTEDEYARRIRDGEQITKAEVRASVRARIQHIMDFLREYVSDAQERPPHEGAIIFDEAQRAWDAAYGKQKFNRSASEPSLLLDIMTRQPEWSAIVGLIGGGQEINSGENGMAEWGDALRLLPEGQRAQWSIYGPPGMSEGDDATAYLGLGMIPGVEAHEVDDLTLKVPLRSYRSPLLAEWVAAVIEGRCQQARDLMDRIGEYPIVMCRDLRVAREWLRARGRGRRRYGLLATSTAVRLRAEGVAASLSATDGRKIAYWYLAPHGDVRSSYAMEVPANEYTSQGLELDFTGVCWGGDLIIADNAWVTRRFAGTSWGTAKGDRRRFTLNSYRVLLTRAREGMVLWVPRGSDKDLTRPRATYDCVAGFLRSCGVSELGA